MRRQEQRALKKANELYRGAPHPSALTVVLLSVIAVPIFVVSAALARVRRFVAP